MYVKLLTDPDKSILESKLNEFLKFVEDKGWELLKVVKYNPSYVPKIKKGKPPFCFAIIVVFEVQNAS